LKFRIFVFEIKIFLIFLNFEFFNKNLFFDVYISTSKVFKHRKSTESAGLRGLHKKGCFTQKSPQPRFSALSSDF